MIQQTPSDQLQGILIVPTLYDAYLGWGLLVVAGVLLARLVLRHRGVRKDQIGG